MYKYFKNIAESSSCSLSGVCSIHPSISALNDILIYEIREAVFYLVKLKEFGFLNKSSKEYCLTTLSLFLINTSLNQKKYLNIINKLNLVKNDLKEKYIKYCSSNELPCEILNTNIDINEKTTITDLIKLAQTNLINKSKMADKSKQCLFELITLFAKLSAVIACKIKRYDDSFDEYDYEILRFFALTNSYSIRIEKIKRRINEFCNIALKLKHKLSLILEERYGKKQNATIDFNENKGHAILVSGDDLIELDGVLKTIENMNHNKSISVYTNGNLLLAHFYPYFQNNKFLKGHWGTNNAQYDFSMFPGTILITRNFLQKIDSLYKGEIYSSKIISFSKIVDIVDDNYSPVILSALENVGFIKCTKKTSLNITYDAESIEKITNDLIQNHVKEAIIVAGNLESKKNLEEYKDKKTLYFSYPLESDILLSVFEKLIKNNIKITAFFPHCDTESLYSIFSLLNSNVKIYISNCSNTLINPHVTEALKNEYGIEIIH